MAHKIKDFLPTPDAAKIKGCTRQTISYAIKHKKLDALKVSGVWLVITNKKWRDFEVNELQRAKRIGKKLQTT